MATYIPNATQTTEPVESRTVESAALEFRTLKTSINARIEDVQDGLDTEIVNRIAGDANLQTQNNAQDVRLQAIEAALLVIGEGGLPGTVYVQRLSGTGAQTSFTLDVSVPSSALIDVFINGIYQNKNTFTIVDDVLTFSEAPPAGTDNVEVVVSITIANVETDASLVSFRATDSTVVVRTAQDKMREWVSVKDFGAVGDGVADDTIAIQAALNVSRSLLVPAGTYLCGPLSIPGNSTIWLDAAAYIMARVGFGINESLITISAVSDVTIHGNGAVLQMRKTDYTSGEWRHCVNIVGANNVKIYDLVVKDSGGDGFYVGGDDVCRNVSIVNCVSDNNRRQGLSITNAINCLVLGGEYKNTVGTLPEAGIDVESNLKDGYYLQNINIIGVLTQNNNGSGILITPQSKFAEISISVLSCTSIDDAMVRGALTVNSAMAYTPETDPALIGKIQGRITVDGFTAIRPKGAGVVSTNWTEYAPTTLLKNIYVLDCGNAKLVTAPNRERCGLLIKGETPSSGLHGASIGNIEIDNFEVRDSRATKLMSAPIYFEPSDEASKPIKNVRMRGVRSTPGDWTVATAGVPVLRAGSLPVHDSSIEHYNEVVVPTGSVTMDIRYSGVTLTNTSSAVSYNLPAGADLLGAEFEFEVGSANYLSLPLVSATDTLMPISTVAGKGIRSNAVGSRVRLKAENGKWRIVSIVGTWEAIP